MDYIFNSLQQKYISPYSTKPIKISLRKKALGFSRAEYPSIIRSSDKKKENKFNEYYRGLFLKKSTDLPKLLTINEDIDVQQNRNCTFADPRYPKFFKNNISRIDKQKNPLNIIESLDDLDKMKHFYESNFHLLINEQINCNNKPLIDILTPKISSVDYNQVHMKLHQFLLPSCSIQLKLKGLCLIIRDPICGKVNNSKSKQSSIKLRLPLSFIPFYYSISHHLFLYFIAKIIKIPHTSEDEIDVSSINLDMNLVKTYVTDIIAEDKLFSLDSILINNESYNASQRPVKYTWLIKNKELELEIQPIILELKANISSQSLTKSTSSKTNEKTLIIRKAISKSLMCYFIKTRYDHWEKPALCYLSSFKLFRKYISYAYGRPMKTNKLIVFLDEHEEKNNKANIHLLEDSINNNNYINNSYSINNDTVNNDNNNSEDIQADNQFPKNKSSFSFFITLHQTNYFFTFYSYKVSLQIDSFKSKKFNFDISFEKMKFLYQIKSNYNIEDIIRKCIIVSRSTETVVCSIELLMGIAFESMEKFFDAKDELNLLDFSLKVSLPRIEWEEMVNIYSSHVKEMKKQNYFLKDHIVQRLLNVDRIKWPDIFSQFQDELGIEVEKKLIKTYHKVKTMKK